MGLGLMPSVGRSQDAAPAPEYPPFEKVVEGYTKVDSKSPDRGALCNIWTREKDGQVLLELPKDFATKKYFIALTVIAVTNSLVCKPAITTSIGGCTTNASH